MTWPPLVIFSYLVHNNLTNVEFCDLTGINNELFECILRGTHSIDEEIATLFAMILGENTEFWLQLQANYDCFCWCEINKLENIWFEYEKEAFKG
jgi:plasmid maintenance system antidote protein VapI